MASANQTANDDTEPTRTRLATLFRIWWAIGHLTALVVIWFELWGLAAAALYAHQRLGYWGLAAVTLFTVKARHHLRDELIGNLRQTYERYIRFTWQTQTAEGWEWPRLEGLELGEFIGWRPALTLTVRSRGRAIPVYEATFIVRRPDSKGQTASGADKWLAGFEDLIRRRFRFSSGTSENDLDDRNRDRITLGHERMPPKVVAA